MLVLWRCLDVLWDWPAVFWFRIPIAIAALLLLRGLPVAPPRLTSDRFDVPSGIAVALGLVTMLMAINRIRELSALWLGLLSALAFAGFAFRQSRAERPIIAMEVFKLPGFALLNLVSVLANVAAFWCGAGALLSVRIPAHSRKAALSWPLVRPVPRWRQSAVTSPGGILLKGWIAGAVAIGAGLLLLGAWTEQTSTILRVTGLIVQGVGLGLFQLAYSDIVTAALPLTERGVAGSLALLTRTLGTVTAASVFFLVFDILQATHGFLEAFQQTFQLAAVLAFVAAGLLALSPRKGGKA